MYQSANIFTRETGYTIGGWLQYMSHSLGPQPTMFATKLFETYFPWQRFCHCSVWCPYTGQMCGAGWCGWLGTVRPRWRWRVINECFCIENIILKSPVSSHSGLVTNSTPALPFSETHRYKMSLYESQQVATPTNRHRTCFRNTRYKRSPGRAVLYIANQFGATSRLITYKRIQMHRNTSAWGSNFLQRYWGAVKVKQGEQ